MTSTEVVAAIAKTPLGLLLSIFSPILRLFNISPKPEIRTHLSCTSGIPPNLGVFEATVEVAVSRRRWWGEIEPIVDCRVWITRQHKGQRFNYYGAWIRDAKGINEQTLREGSPYYSIGFVILCDLPSVRASGGPLEPNKVYLVDEIYWFYPTPTVLETGEHLIHVYLQSGSKTHHVSPWLISVGLQGRYMLIEPLLTGTPSAVGLKRVVVRRLANGGVAIEKQDL